MGDITGPLRPGSAITLEAGMHQDRRIDGYNFKQGWPAAVLTIIAAIAINAAVTWFHFTHANRSPNDVMFRAKGAPAAEMPREHPPE